MSNNYHYRRHPYTSIDQENNCRSQSLELTIPHFHHLSGQGRQKNWMQVESGVSYASPQESPIHKISIKLSRYLQQTKRQVQEQQKQEMKKTKNEEIRKQSDRIIKREKIDRFNYFKDNQSSAIQPIRHRTIRKYLVNNWSPFPQKSFNKSCTLQNSPPSKLLDKPKSMLIIRSNKMKSKNGEDYQLGAVRQIPIHHTMYHFRKGASLKTRTDSSLDTIEGRLKIDRKFHRAVQQIIQLKLSLRDTADTSLAPLEEEGGLICSSIFIQQKTDTPDQRPKDLNLAYKKQKKLNRFRADRHHQFVGNHGQQQISPWNRRSNTNDFQLAM